MDEHRLKEYLIISVAIIILFFVVFIPVYFVEKNKKSSPSDGNKTSGLSMSSNNIKSPYQLGKATFGQKNKVPSQNIIDAKRFFYSLIDYHKYYNINSSNILGNDTYYGSVMITDTKKNGVPNIFNYIQGNGDNNDFVNFNYKNLYFLLHRVFGETSDFSEFNPQIMNCKNNNYDTVYNQCVFNFVRNTVIMKEKNHETFASLYNSDNPYDV